MSKKINGNKDLANILEQSLYTDKILEYRLQGESSTSIAKKLQVSPNCVNKHIKKVIGSLTLEIKEQAQEALQLDLMRLDNVTQKLMAIIDGKEKMSLKLSAIDKLLKVIDTRSKLLGVYDLETTKQAVNINIATDKLAALSIDELKQKFSQEINTIS